MEGSKSFLLNVGWEEKPFYSPDKNYSDKLASFLSNVNIQNLIKLLLDELQKGQTLGR